MSTRIFKQKIKVISIQITWFSTSFTWFRTSNYVNSSKKIFADIFMTLIHKYFIYIYKKNTSIWIRTRKGFLQPVGSICWIGNNKNNINSKKNNVWNQRLNNWVWIKDTHISVLQATINAVQIIAPSTSKSLIAVCLLVRVYLLSPIIYLLSILSVPVYSLVYKLQE